MRDSGSPFENSNVNMVPASYNPYDCVLIFLLVFTWNDLLDFRIYFLRIIIEQEQIPSELSSVHFDVRILN